MISRSENIIKVLWELKKKGRAKSTIKNTGKALDVLNRWCDLNNPEQVKTFIATFDRTNCYKNQLSCAYDNYVKVNGLKWEKPQYHYTNKMPKIPQETKIDQIIANAPKKLATALSMSKDTGLRPIELTNLKLRDIDLVKGAVYPTTAKHGNPRVIKITNKTLNMLNKYIANRNIEQNDKLFGWWTPEAYGNLYREARNRVAKKLSDKSITSIKLYDLRHFFATMLYAKTKDILFVKQQMGHKSINSTLVYTQLLQFDREENYTVRVSQNVEQSTKLIEAGFEYVTDQDGNKLFRKRK